MRRADEKLKLQLNKINIKRKRTRKVKLYRTPTCELL